MAPVNRKLLLGAVHGDAARFPPRSGCELLREGRGAERMEERAHWLPPFFFSDDDDDAWESKGRPLPSPLGLHPWAERGASGRKETVGRRAVVWE